MKFITGALVGMTGVIIGAVGMAACVVMALKDEDMARMLIKISHGTYLN